MSRNGGEKGIRSRKRKILSALKGSLNLGSGLYSGGCGFSSVVVVDDIVLYQRVLYQREGGKRALAGGWKRERNAREDKTAGLCYIAHPEIKVRRSLKGTGTGRNPSVSAHSMQVGTQLHPMTASVLSITSKFNAAQVGSSPFFHALA